MVKKKGSKSSNRTGSSAQQGTVPVIEPSSTPTVAAIGSGPPQPVQQMEIETDISTIQHDSSGSNAPEGNNEELLNDGITSNVTAQLAQSTPSLTDVETLLLKCSSSSTTLTLQTLDCPVNYFATSDLIARTRNQSR